MDILTLNNVSKRFGSKQVVKNLTFSVPEHKVFGFIGKNGAGKTTTMKMILGLVKMDEGEITVNGERVTFGQNSTNKYIGYLPDVPEFYGYMTTREYLMLCGRITGMKDVNIKQKTEELLEIVGLSEEKKRIKGFSPGMKQRLGNAQALLNSPKLLICDEPTSALDPLGRKEILDVLAKVKEHTTVIFSTHILSDVERICDQVAFLHGNVAAGVGSAHLGRRGREGARRMYVVQRDGGGCERRLAEGLVGRDDDGRLAHGMSVGNDQALAVRVLILCAVFVGHHLLSLGP